MFTLKIQLLNNITLNLCIQIILLPNNFVSSQQMCIIINGTFKMQIKLCTLKKLKFSVRFKHTHTNKEQIKFNMLFKKNEDTT